jgi:hypothetical protein
MLRHLLLGLGFVIGLSACASAPKKPPREIPRLIVDSLRFRTRGEGFGCQSSTEFLQGLDFSEIHQCLAGVKESVKLSFVLDRKSENPEFVLKEGEKTPGCVKAVLSKIPVPREIFFQAEDLDCYASGLGMEKGSVQIDVELPIVTLFRNADDARNLVLSWVMTSFWNEQRSAILAKPFPEALCHECLGEDHWIRSLKPPRAFWPAPEE